MGGSSSKEPSAEQLKDHHAEKLLRESAHGKNRGRSTESMMYGRRRRSDASLQSILRDPVVQEAFRRYLEADLAEELILYWLEVDQLMDLIMEKTGVETVLPRAKHIFAKFLEDGAAFAIDLDSITREDIAAAVSDPNADVESIQRVFEVAFVKVFQKLKFEYMPRFLVSEQFMSLPVFKNSFENEKEASQAGLSYASDMDLSYVLSSPVGLRILKEFFYSVGGNKLMHSEEMVEFVRETDDYKEAGSNEHRGKRLELIFKRFESLLPRIKHLGIAQDLYKKEKEAWHRGKFPPNLLDDARNETMDCLDAELFPKFRESEHFAKLTGRVSRIFKKEMHEIDSHSLKSFAEERKFEEYKEMDNVDLKSLMSDSLGLFFFRKFAVKHFQEENVLFWCEVNHFNSGDYTKPPVGTALQYNGMLEVAELQDMRARKLLSKYVEKNSRMELNLSHALREELTQKIVNDEVEIGMFDRAQKEIYNLLNRNLWSKFQDSELYRSWHQKRSARFERRLASLK